MNNATNVGFIAAATALISLGVNTISTELLTGVIEIVLGIAVFAAYEFIPTKPQ